MYSLLFFVDIHFLTGTAVRGARLREGEGRGGRGINPNLCKVWAFSPKEMWNLEVPRRLEMHSKIINLWWLWKSENVFHIHTDQIKIPCDCLARKIRNSDWRTHSDYKTSWLLNEAVMLISYFRLINPHLIFHYNCQRYTWQFFNKYTT